MNGNIPEDTSILVKRARAEGMGQDIETGEGFGISRLTDKVMFDTRIMALAEGRKMTSLDTISLTQLLFPKALRSTN